MIKKIKAAVKGTTVDYPVIDEYSGSGQGSGSGSGNGGIYVDEEGEDTNNEDTNSINQTTDLENEPSDDNSENKTEVQVIPPDLKTRGSGNGSTSFLPVSFLLLTTSLLVQLI